MTVTTYPGDPDRVATLLPGRGYSPVAPLLRYSAMLLRDRGWTVREIWWEDADAIDLSAAAARSDRELDAVTAPVHLVVAKSLGTSALPAAAARGLPGVWLTPILTDPTILAALPLLTAPTLLIGGTSDGLWNGDVARTCSAQVMEVAGGNHSLEVGTSVATSLDVLRLVMNRVATFVDALADGSRPTGSAAS